VAEESQAQRVADLKLARTGAVVAVAVVVAAVAEVGATVELASVAIAEIVEEEMAAAIAAWLVELVEPVSGLAQEVETVAAAVVASDPIYQQP
jgi:hypothetical protein